ncbi:MAG TPA: hypothetical protein VHB20_11585 [Verrucomicrobiae bacterium]|jgi:hypothetical protein|nr:hypothetical protein [Verrucomicrobiae bacterium]
MKIKHVSRGALIACLALFAAQPAAQAYPPAPDALIYGLVKDQYGNPLANVSDLVILQTTTGVQVVGHVQPNLAIGVNYSVQVPMDAGSLPPLYVSNALTAGAQFQLLVVINSVTNVPSEMQGATLTLGAPSQTLAQNLTLGQNLNNSGVPLAWAQAFLASLGLNVPPGSINPFGVYTPDGRTLQQEYLLGNFPYQTNAFSVRIVSQSGGSALLAFNTAAGRTYTAFGSADLKSWTPLTFTIPALGASPVAAYYSSAVQALQIQTVQPGAAPPMQFFRLQLQ